MDKYDDDKSGVLEFDEFVLFCKDAHLDPSADTLFVNKEARRDATDRHQPRPRALTLVVVVVVGRGAPPRRARSSATAAI